MSEFTLECSRKKFRMTNSVFVIRFEIFINTCFDQNQWKWAECLLLHVINTSTSRFAIQEGILASFFYKENRFFLNSVSLSFSEFSPLESLTSVEFMALCHLAPQVSEVQHCDIFIVWIAAVRFLTSKYCRSNNAVTICLLVWSKWLHNQ